MITFKVGILGTGHMAEIIADTLTDLEGFTPYAVASRDADRAKSFASTFNIEKSYGSYEELVNDPEIELVYIATVNSTHAELAKLALNAGKPVLVEKPFSYNTETALEVFKLADEKKLFCGEAMWVRYMPTVKQMRDLIKTGIIGDIRYVNASIGYDLKNKERLIKPELAGGAMLDVGIYPVTFLFMLLGGVPYTVAPSYSRLSTGVDAQETIQIVYKSGQMATLFSTMMYKADNRATVYGTRGHMEVDNVNCPEDIKFFDDQGEVVAEIKVPDNQLNGYEYEFLAAREAIIIGKSETEESTRTDVLLALRFMDTFRKTVKVVFPLPGEPDPATLPNPQVMGRPGAAPSNGQVPNGQTPNGKAPSNGPSGPVSNENKPVPGPSPSGANSGIKGPFPTPHIPKDE